MKGTISNEKEIVQIGRMRYTLTVDTGNVEVNNTFTGHITNYNNGIEFGKPEFHNFIETMRKLETENRRDI